MLTDWQGADYDRISAPHAAMGSAALDRLELHGDERVLDAGCGSGRLTEALLERLPRGRVVALDASASMLTEAARRLARFGDRVTLVQADLGLPPLPVSGAVDAILSTATFHWVLDHAALFAGLAGVLRADGQLSFQCGGVGNAAELIAAARAEGVETAGRFHMAGVDETLARLTAAGFRDVHAWLEPRDIAFGTRAQVIDYIVTPYLRPASGLPEAELQRVAGAMADRLGLVLSYVRLEVVARRAAASAPGHEPTDHVAARSG
jgi:trans-aconitate 2-methyltransferase